MPPLENWCVQNARDQVIPTSVDWDVAIAAGVSLIAQFIGDLFASFLGGWIADGFIGRKRAKAARHRVFLGGLRVVSGTQSGLGGEWLIGEWSIRSGRLSMETLVVPIVETVKGSRRPARVDELVGASDTVIVKVRTKTAELEWSILRRFDGLALRALSVPESTAANSDG